MMKNPPSQERDLCIIIVNYNSGKMLLNCLASIENNPFVTPESTEIHVVDNASTDGSVETAMEGFPAVKWTRNTENRGFAFANNQALRETSTPFILLLNSDTDIEKLNISLCLQHLKNQSRIGLLGPGLIFPDGRKQVSNYHFSTPLRVFSELIFLTAWLSPLFSKCLPEKISREVDYVQGSVLFLKKKMLDETGLLDENFFFYHEEMDIAYRAREKGWLTFYEPHTSAVHIFGGSSKGLGTKKMVWYYEQLFKYYKKHHREKMWIFRFSLRAGLCIRKGLDRIMMMVFRDSKKREDIDACNAVLEKK